MESDNYLDQEYEHENTIEDISDPLLKLSPVSLPLPILCNLNHTLLYV